MGRILSPIVLLLLACASLFYLPLGLRALWDPGEARFAEIAREILQLQDWLVPHLNSVIYLDHPPFAYWVTAAIMKVWGSHAGAARLGCATFGVLTVGLTYRWGENWKNERVGLLAAGMVATSIGFFAFTQYASIDMILAFWNTLTLWAGSALLVERSASRARRLTYLVGLGFAGGILTRGPVALLLPAAALLAAYWGQGRRIPVVKRPWKVAAILCAFLTLPWVMMICMRYPIYPYYFFLHDYIPRFGGDVHAMGQPFYFYIPILLVGFLPWGVFLPQVMRTWLGHDGAALQRDPEGSVMVAWIGLVVVFFSLFPTKNVGAIVPVFPALALLLANEFDEALDQESHPARPMPAWVGHGVVILIGCLFSVLVVLKMPLHVLEINAPEWKTIVDQSALFTLALGLGVFVLVGVWGMRQTLVCIGGVMLVQVLLLTSASSLAPELDAYRSSRSVAERFESHAGARDVLVMYQPSPGRFPFGLVFYTGRRLPVFGNPGALALGQEQDPEADRWFVPEDRALETLQAQPAGTWGVTDMVSWTALRQSAPDLFQPVGPLDTWVLFKKQR